MTRSISLFILLGAWWQAGAADVDEYTVKAAYLYNFAKFVEWPAEAFRGPADPVSICVLGQNPFGRKLREAIDGKLVGGRSFALSHIQDVGRAAGCHMVFVASSERDRFSAILEDVKGGGILTVGDTPGFAKQGGVVNFKVAGGAVKMEVNLPAARQKNLQISAKLLALAQIVQ